MDHSSSNLVGADIYNSFHAIAEGWQRVSFDCSHHHFASPNCLGCSDILISSRRSRRINRHYRHLDTVYEPVPLG